MKRVHDLRSEPRRFHLRSIPVVVCATAIAVLLAAAPEPSAAQEFSEKKEIAVFRLNYYGAPRDPVPQSQTIIQLGDVLRFERTVEAQTTEIFRQAVGAIDEKIRSVFVEMGRFDVIGMQMRLNHENVNAFVEALRDYRAESVELPETVLLGEEAFTKADFNRLVGGFVVVIPSVSFYDLSREAQNDGEVRYEATIETSFSFINADTLETVDRFSVETAGSDADPEQAMREAVEGIPAQLTFRVRSMDLFRIRTGVLAVDGRSVTIEFGRNMGVRPGDEYAIVRPRESLGGRTFQEETGLLVVEEVRSDFSVARLIYAEEQPRVGDQLEEVPRFGIETSPYAGAVVGTQGGASSGVIGIRAAASRGFYSVRPIAGLEIPLRQVGGGFFPLNSYGGAELNWYLGRFKLAPAVAVGVGGGFPLGGDNGENFYLTHIGGHVRASLMYALSRDTYGFVEAGYAAWVGLLSESVPASLSSYFRGYYGIRISAGIALK
jgi:hypothetical protein